MLEVTEGEAGDEGGNIEGLKELLVYLKSLGS